MDTRTFETYPSLDAALDAGVPKDRVEQVDVVTIHSGPFKGRQYLKNEDGSLGRRVFPGKQPVQA